MIVYLRNPRLSLWESWHAEGVTERGYEGPLRPGIRRATSPIGRGFGAINDHLREKDEYVRIVTNNENCLPDSSESGKAAFLFGSAISGLHFSRTMLK